MIFIVFFLNFQIHLDMFIKVYVFFLLNAVAVVIVFLLFLKMYGGASGDRFFSKRFFFHLNFISVWFHSYGLNFQSEKSFIEFHDFVATKKEFHLNI